MMPSMGVSRFHTLLADTQGQLLVPSRRVLMAQQCHHVVIEFLPLRVMGRLLPRTS
jgi:hypothetical protein